MKKSTYGKSLLLILFFSIGSIVNAQAPFGDPPPSPGVPPVNPPTPDREVSPTPTLPTTYIPLCPECPIGDPPSGVYCGGSGSGSGGGASCIWEDIENTGNDVQLVDDADVSLVAQVMAWDGDCPHFSLVVSGDPNTQSPLNAAFLVAINGSRYGTVHDPDIIVAQKKNNTNEIDILMVYELHVPSGGNTISYIAYEQWKYNYVTTIIEMVEIPSSYATSNIISFPHSYNPNIDANNRNEVAVVFEKDGDLFSYVDYITTPIIFNPANASSFNNNYNYNENMIDVGHCAGLDNLHSPDVSISDNVSSNSYISYVYNHSTDLYLIQDNFGALYSRPLINCRSAQTQFLAEDFINPRISSPSRWDITFETECAVTAVSTNYRDIALISNHGTGGPMDHLTNLNNGGQNLLQDCDQTMPSITYAHGSGSTVAVAWTYDDCMGYINSDKEVISVAYQLSTGSRIPNNVDYFMKVNQANVMDQFASSVAGESLSNYSGDWGYVFYTLASDAGAIIYKMSNVNNQPQLRIKISSEVPNIKPSATVYPNPTNGELNLDLSNIDSESLVLINIYTIDGKVVHQENRPLKELKSTYDLSGLGKGVYFIEVKSSDLNYSNKIIVE